MAKLKLSYPSFRQPKTVTFGTGSRKTLAECDRDQTAFFLSGSREVRALFEAALGAIQTQALVCIKPKGEPTWEMIEAGADFLAKQSIHRIVAVGGGSVLDWCRLAWAHYAGLISMDATGRLQMHDSAEGLPQFWLVPTTCATGAEAAAVAVFADSAGRKIPVVSTHFLADHVILDGQFLQGMEPAALANSLCDALSHAIESFVSIVPSRLAEDAAVNSLQRVFAAWHLPPSKCRNEQLLEAAYLAGVAASNCSVGVVHALAHTLAAEGVTHGHGNALALLAGIKLNADTESMKKLIDRLGMSSVGELCQKTRVIVDAARSAEDSRLAHQLSRGDVRKSVIARMMDDVCLRTNPKRVTAGDLGDFIDGVVRGIEAA